MGFTPDNDEEKEDSEVERLKRAQKRREREEEELAFEDEEEEEEERERENEREQERRRLEKERTQGEEEQNFRWMAMAQSMQATQVVEGESLAPKPIPPFIQKFLDTYKDHAKYCKYDEKKGALSFEATEGGAKALKQFLEDNPSVKVVGEFPDVESARKALRTLYDAGVDLQKIVGLQIGGKKYEGDEVNNQISTLMGWRPTPRPGQFY